MLIYIVEVFLLNTKILIIEDEVEIQNILKELLIDAGYVADVANDGLEGITLFRQNKYDLVLLDLMLPKIDGYAVCEMIRKESYIPVVMLTAMGDEDDQIKGFDVLADDYITKPFSIKLVLKRIESLLRRSHEKHEKEESILCHGKIQLDPVSLSVFVSGSEISLTKLEFELLYLLMKNKGRVFTRDELLDLVWGDDFTGYSKAVNIHIMNIRRKLDVNCIETVRGVGYRFVKKD